MKLWFAWKIVLLQYRKQLTESEVTYAERCDLLGKSYFCSIANNTIPFHQSNNKVVICLENRTFAVSQTTHYGISPSVWRLWFAWKIVLLQYRKQQKLIHTTKWHVVICLENRTFAVSQTTFRKKILITHCCDLLGKSYFCSIANNTKWQIICPNRLWFAWKIVLLQYRKQLGSWAIAFNSVVICLENRTFAVSQTTPFQG